MRRIAPTIVLVAGLAISTASLATTEPWTEREICRAAVKTYFFLGELPADADDQGEYLGFVSAKGNVYTCRLAGERAVFRWLTKSGEPMRSELTRFRVSDGALVIETDMSTKTFKK